MSDLASYFRVPVPTPRPSQAEPMYMVGDHIAGLLAPGNVDLTTRPQTRNADGSVSTVRSMSFGEDGQEVLVPTVAPSGTILSDEGAQALYRATGQNLGKFRTPQDADAYAQALHLQQEQMIRTIMGAQR